MTKENGVLGETVEVAGNTVPKGQGGLPRATGLLVVSLVIKIAPVMLGEVEHFPTMHETLGLIPRMHSLTHTSTCSW